jgi:hypothetical protein
MEKCKRYLNILARAGDYSQDHQKRQLLIHYARWVNYNFIDCTVEDIGVWPLVFHKQLAKEFGMKLLSKLSPRNSLKALTGGYRGIDLFGKFSRQRCQSFKSVIDIIYIFLPNVWLKYWHRGFSCS